MLTDSNSMANDWGTKRVVRLIEMCYFQCSFEQLPVIEDKDRDRRLAFRLTTPKNSWKDFFFFLFFTIFNYFFLGGGKWLKMSVDGILFLSFSIYDNKLKCFYTIMQKNFTN